MPTDHDQVARLKVILQSFSDATGLKINYKKSLMVPINTSNEKCQELANIFGCKREMMSFTYFGLPMGTTRPKLDDLMPLIYKIDKGLSSISNLQHTALGLW